MTKLFKTPPKTGPAHVTAEAKLTLSKHASRAMGSYAPREKLPGEVQAPENDLWQRPVYRTGAGYWNMIRRDFPERFWMMAGASRALGVKMVKLYKDGEEERVYLDELPIGVGRYQDEPEIQCGIFCEAAKQEYARVEPIRLSQGEER